MIRCTQKPEPDYFERQVRRPGKAWLAKNPKPKMKRPGVWWRPRDYWCVCRADLCAAFDCLCAYSAMYELVGTVDHFVPCDEDETRIYEWSNYRYASHWINASKKAAKVLDPFDVGDEWFEIILPSLQLVLTDKVPDDKRELAEYTIRRLRLDHDEQIIRQRAAWYGAYQKRGDLDELREHAPLIARAVEKQIAAGKMKDDR